MNRPALILLIGTLLAGPASAAGPATNPHGDIDIRCDACHVASSWEVPRPAPSFDHAQVGFPLIGAHTDATCSGCHADLKFKAVASACADCHLDVHRGRYGTRCDECHAPTGWAISGDERDRHLELGFPLMGAHAVADCDACHQGTPGDETMMPPLDCIGCHLSDYRATSAPAHAANGFGTGCQDCHNVTAGTWGPEDFRHTSAFPLRGAHAQAECAACHTDGFAGTPTDCYACHRADYEAATEPNHVEANFPTDCRACHGESSWAGADFNHAATGFALLGAHASAACVQCHADGYTNTPTDCYACHRADYEATTDPNHVASGIGNDCALCHHNTTSWDGADFDHAAAGFALTGAHATATCGQCHANGYTDTRTDCDACHHPDYASTTDPNHVSAGFGTQCEACHTTSAWQPSTWDHDSLFPIYSGRHSNVWDACATCHTVATDYAVFECVLCHDHNRSVTDQSHSGVLNYVYQSSACYQCHPRGNGD